MPTDLEQLLEMGFEKERAELAVKKAGGLQDALTWLEAHQDKSIEEIRASDPVTSDDPEGPADLKPGEEPKSLKCDDCGKKFRSQSQAEYHAEKSGHSNFSESTEEIAPLTEEEKQNRLAELKEKLAEKKAVLAQQAKMDNKRNEEIRRKATKESQDLKEELVKKEQIKEAAQKRREKREEIEARNRIRARIEADKEERRQKAAREKAEREGRAPPPSIPDNKTSQQTSHGPVTSKPASEYTETRLRLLTPAGSVMKHFPVSTTLFEVATAVCNENGFQPQSFMQNFPKRIFDSMDFGATLKELGLVPSASLNVK